MAQKRSCANRKIGGFIFGPAVIVKVSFENRLFSVSRQCRGTCECVTNCWFQAHIEGACIIRTGKVICYGYDSYKEVKEKPASHLRCPSGAVNEEPNLPRGPLMQRKDTALLDCNQTHIHLSERTCHQLL